MQERFSHLADFVLNLPHESGVYKFFDASDQLVYIGKAKSLRNRVGSYFTQTQHSRKTARLVSEVARIEYIVVPNEFEALLLENNLIKANQPKYNILLKDDKTYPYICVTQEPFPRIFPTRQREDGQKHRYFGPYASPKVMHVVLDLIRELYPLRACTLPLTPANIAADKWQVCLEYHIKNCLGPCAGHQSQEAYQEDVRQAIQILRGNLGPARQYFRDKMMACAAELQFEMANMYKLKLASLEHYQQKSTVVNPNISDLDVCVLLTDEANAYAHYMKVVDGAIVQALSTEIRKKLEEADEDILLHALLDFRTKCASESRRVLTNIEVQTDVQGFELHVPKIGDLKKLVELALKNALYYKKERLQGKMEIAESQGKNRSLIMLKADLNLSTLPRHIECFDNSNLQGTNAVSSMVCFIDGKPSKKNYRHFNVQSVEGPDDFETMREAVRRRYTRVTAEGQPLPDLIVIDGGKGQLSAACESLKALGLYGQIPIIGIAKRLEEIYFPEDQHPLHISKKSPSLLLIQRIRDEAHRFGITFHRDKRSASSLVSELDQIKGIGDKTRDELLRHFQSFARIKSADAAELAAVIGPAKARLVRQHFERADADDASGQS